MRNPSSRRKFSSPFLVNPFFRRVWVRVFSILFFVLALLALQQVATTHGYSHFGTALGERVTTEKDQPHAPATSHSCALCVAVSGVNLISPPITLALSGLKIATDNPIDAVSPAPTFSFSAAYHSRAPPAPLD